MSSSPLRLAAAAGLCCALLASGCVPGYLRLSLRTQPDSNAGQPLYCLIRNVDRTVFSSETYSEAAQKATEKDPGLLAKEILFPGQRLTRYLKVPKKDGIGLYFLYTAPGGEWRVFLDPPLPLSFSATVGKHEVTQTKPSL